MRSADDKNTFHAALDLFFLSALHRRRLAIESQQSVGSPHTAIGQKLNVTHFKFNRVAFPAVMSHCFDTAFEVGLGRIASIDVNDLDVSSSGPKLLRAPLVLEPEAILFSISGAGLDCASPGGLGGTMVVFFPLALGRCGIIMTTST